MGSPRLRSGTAAAGRGEPPAPWWSAALLAGSCAALLATGGIPRPAWAPALWRALRVSHPFATGADRHVLLGSAWLAWCGVAALSARFAVGHRRQRRKSASLDCHRTARAATVTPRTRRRPATRGADPAEHPMPTPTSPARAHGAGERPSGRLPLGSFGLLLRGARRLAPAAPSAEPAFSADHAPGVGAQRSTGVPEGKRLWLPPVALHDGEWSRLVVSALSGGLREGSRGPRVRRMLLDATEIVVELADDAEPGPPFEPIGVRRWRLPRDSSLLPLVSPEHHNRTVRESLLVNLCREDPSTAAPGRRLELVDLACLRTTALLGPPEHVEASLALAVVDAVGHRWSDPAGLLLVGFGAELQGIEGVDVVADLRAALGALEARRPGEVGTTLVVVPRSCTAERLAPSAPTPAGGSGVPVGLDPLLLAALIERVEADPSLALLSAVHHERIRETLSLGRDLTEPRGRAEGENGDSGRARWTARAAARPNGPVLRGAGVDVQVLGPLVILGTDRDLRRSYRLAELVAYLALHPEGASSSAWSTALWPDRRVPGQTIANRLCEARRVLGTAPDGQPRLRRGGAGHVLVDVDSDWRRFKDAAATSSPAAWEGALSLVRGRPFEGLPFGDWVVHDGLLGDMERSIGELANRLCARLLDSGQPDRAEAAARVALRAVPYDESLYRVLMRCADAAGNRAKLDALLDELGRLLECRENPLAAVHPETAALYRALASRRVQAAG